MDTIESIDGRDVPADYDELFRMYYTHVVGLVRHCGKIDPQNVEDVACEIMSRFYERDFLPRYNPKLTFQHDGVVHAATFKNFLTKFVQLYLKGHGDKQGRRRKYEVLLADQPVGSGDQTWIEIFGGTVESAAEVFHHADDEAQLITYLRAYLADVPRNSAYDTCDLLAIFDEMLKQIAADGSYSIPSLRVRFNVSSSAMFTWIWRLKACLAEATGRPLPARRRRTKKPSCGG